MLKTYIITTATGEIEWEAEDADHARDQHIDCYGTDNPWDDIIAIRVKDPDNDRDLTD